MHKLVGNTESRLASARWIRLEANATPLILGDGCVVCVGGDGSIGWPFKFGPHWRELYLPVGKSLAIVAMAPTADDTPSLDADALNSASAELAREYIYASRCTDVETVLAARIGSGEPLIADADIDEVVDDAMRGGDDPHEANRSAQPLEKVGRNEPCPCGSGIKFKKCCGSP